MKNLSLFLTTSLLLVSCSSTEQVTGDSIKIGGAFALTGFAAEWGEADHNGALLALEEINEKGGIDGRKVELVVEDIESEDRETVTVFHKLISVDSVQAIIGATWMDAFNGGAPIANDNAVVTITPSSFISAVKQGENYPYVFSTWFKVEDEAQTVIEHMDARYEKIALIHENSAFWNDWAETITTYADKSSLTVIEDSAFDIGVHDFRTVLARMKQEGVEAIFFGFDAEASLHGFLKQRIELGVEADIYSSEFIEGFAQDEDYSELLEGAHFVTPVVDLGTFPDRYRERFGSDPVFSAVNSYDATMIILEALKAGYTTGENIQKFVVSNSFDTVTFGRTKFDDVGGIEGGEFVIKRIKDGIGIPAE